MSVRTVLTTFLEAALSVFGIRSAYEQPRYHVIETLSPAIEIRDYAARDAVETTTRDGEAAAFGRLFRYITGANVAGAALAMTAPVEEGPRSIAMTIPVERSAGPAVMRFFLPQDVAAAGAPVPKDKAVLIVHLPAARLGVIRFSGRATPSVRDGEAALLRTALDRAHWVPQGNPVYFSYDPPFTLPFLRRNEVAFGVERGG